MGSLFEEMAALNYKTKAKFKSREHDVSRLT